MFPKMVSTKGLTKSVGEACPHWNSHRNRRSVC